MSKSIEVTVPPIGGAEQVLVAELLVAKGDTVAIDQSLVTLESDKASMEVPAPVAGEVLEISVTAGSEVAEGSVLLVMSADEVVASASTTTSATPSEPQTATSPPAAPPRSQTAPRPAKPSSPAALPYASPAVRRLARELGVNLDRVTGSGRNGRILATDVEAAHSVGPATQQVGTGLPPMPVIDFSQFGEIDEQRLTRINKLTGESVHRSWLHVPHVTQFDEADITELEAFRKEHKAEAAERGIKLTFVSFLLATVAATLREFPRLNSSLSADGSAIVLKRYINIGVAVSTPKGLVVPVIRNVDQKRLYELASDLLDVSARAREGKLTPSDFQGGTFTISSLGGIGGTAFTPIVNAPEAAILGVSRSKMQPIWDGSEFVPRLMLPLSLSYDHRIVDGAEAAGFTSRLAELLANIRDLLL